MTITLLGLSCFMFGAIVSHAFLVLKYLKYEMFLRSVAREFIGHICTRCVKNKQRAEEILK